MSWMYSDEEYWKQLKREQKEIKASLKYWEKLEKQLLKQLWVPVWDKQGQAFIEPKKHAAWRRAVKWNARPLNTNGQYIQDALAVMRQTEANGYEAGMKTLKYVDVNMFGILDIVDKFYHHGHEFSDKFVRSNPDLLKEYPKLSKYLDVKDPEMTHEEMARSNEALHEAIEFTIATRDSIKLSDVETSKVNREISELEAVKEVRKVNKTSTKR